MRSLRDAEAVMQLPRHVADAVERRWTSKLEQEVRAWKQARSRRRPELAEYDRSRNSRPTYRKEPQRSFGWISGISG